MSEKRKLPDGWQWATLKNLGEFISGGTPAKAASEYWGEPFPFVTGADITDIYISRENARAFLTEKGLYSGKTAICKPNTVLIVSRTRVGRAGVAAELMGASQDVTGLICNDTACPEYVARYLVHKADYLIENARGSTILGLTRDFVNDIEIPLPPIKEQRRIAAVLDEKLAAVAQARQAAEAQLAAARGLSAAYLREVFDGREAQTWPLKRIGDIAVTTSGTTPSRSNIAYYQNGTIAWIKTGELVDKKIDSAEEHVTELALRETSLRILPEDTLLIAMYGQGQTRGRTGILGIPATINQASFAILPNPGLFNPYFLQLWFRHNYLRLRLETENRGGNQPNLNGQILNNLEVHLPDVKTQKQLVNELAEKLKAAKTVETAIKNQIGEIEQLPGSYLRQAFNGEL